uniref:Uncharacterized protein n=1 Tax=Timema genevievae TaxID=629358 RepID=A0A7R9PKD1_TIMGE|nr:unnamed protein product [Timema genevievae]
MTSNRNRIARQQVSIRNPTTVSVREGRGGNAYVGLHSVLLVMPTSQLAMTGPGSVVTCSRRQQDRLVIEELLKPPEVVLDIQNIQVDMQSPSGDIPREQELTVPRPYREQELNSPRAFKCLQSKGRQESKSLPSKGHQESKRLLSQGHQEIKNLPSQGLQESNSLPFQGLQESKKPSGEQEPIVPGPYREQELNSPRAFKSLQTKGRQESKKMFGSCYAESGFQQTVDTLLHEQEAMVVLLEEQDHLELDF